MSKFYIILCSLLIIAMLAAIGVNIAHIVDLRHDNAEEAEAWEKLSNASWIVMVNGDWDDYGFITWYTDTEPQEVTPSWGTRYLELGHYGAIQWFTGYPIWFDWDGDWILDGNTTIIVVPVHGSADDVKVYK